MRTRWVLAAAAAVLRRPALWGTALGQAGRLAPRRWWRRRPPLPLPSAEYLRFRLETAYGREARPRGADVVTYLRWCRAWRALETAPRKPWRRRGDVCR